MTPVSTAAQRAAQTLARSFETGRAAELRLPRPPSALELAALGVVGAAAAGPTLCEQRRGSVSASRV